MSDLLNHVKHRLELRERYGPDPQNLDRIKIALWREAVVTTNERVEALSKAYNALSEVDDDETQDLAAVIYSKLLEAEAEQQRLLAEFKIVSPQDMYELTSSQLEAAKQELDKVREAILFLEERELSTLKLSDEGGWRVCHEDAYIEAMERLQRYMKYLERLIEENE